MDEIIERTTPGGNTARLHQRDGTNDGAVAQAILGDDEYRLRSAYPIAGWVLDIGAHIGSVAIAIALDCPDARVVAVEALPQNADEVAGNVELNGLAGRVLVESAGATDDATRTVDVTYNYRRVGVGRTGEQVDPGYLSQCRYVGNIFQEDGAHEQDADTVTVPGLSLSAILSRHGIDRVALMKIDCEGCEWSFLNVPQVAAVRTIVGEAHHVREDMIRADLDAVLGATHRVTFHDEYHFTAERR